MRIVMSSQGKNPEALLDERFGRCSYFAVWDSQLNHFEFHENKSKDGNQGAGIGAAQQVLDINGDILITEKLGPKAFNVLNQSGMKLFQCREMTLKKAVDALSNEGLKKLEKAYR